MGAKGERVSAALIEVIERIANHGSVDDFTVAGIRAELRDALHAYRFAPSEAAAQTQPESPQWSNLRRHIRENLSEQQPAEGSTK